MARRLQVTQSCPLLAVGGAAVADDAPVRDGPEGGGEPAVLLADVDAAFVPTVPVPLTSDFECARRRF